MNIRNFIQICIVENIKVLDLLLLFFDQLFDYLYKNKDKNCAAERFKDLNVFRTCILWNIYDYTMILFNAEIRITRSLLFLVIFSGE